MKITTYLRDNCSVRMPHLQNNARRKRYSDIKSPVHVFNEIIKLNGVEFHCNKVIVKEAKTPPRTIYSNNTLIKSSNLLEPLPNPTFKTS